MYLKTECNNEDEVMTHLMEKHGQELLYLTYSYVRNKEAAQDLTQEVFIKCYQSLHTYKGSASVKTWLWRIAINHCKDYLRSWHFRHVSLENNPNDLAIGTSREVIEKEVIRKEEDKMLAEAVLLLPVKYREVVYLYYFEEHSLVEIEEILNVNLNTIKTRLRKAKQLLKKEWEENNNGRKIEEFAEINEKYGVKRTDF
nr:sigma-70 family RNA polymerase sigma factor [Sutcliffiella horikoshii]